MIKIFLSYFKIHPFTLVLTNKKRNITSSVSRSGISIADMLAVVFFDKSYLLISRAKKTEKLDEKCFVIYSTLFWHFHILNAAQLLENIRLFNKIRKSVV